MDPWTNDLHRLWTTRRSTACAPSCPRASHRLWPVVPSDRPLLHMAVHCSATRRVLSPPRVKAVTSSCRRGLWERSSNLGTRLGRSRPPLCTGCAELSVLHSEARLSTASAHRDRGQKTGAELRKRGYPRYPQALLLLPTIESEEFVSKRVLCTTRCLGPACHPSRLDPDGRLVSVRCVRLDPGVLPLRGADDTESDDEARHRARSAGNSRRRQQ